MESTTWILMANVAVWIGIGGYVAFLAKGQSALKKRIALKEHMDNV